MAVQGGERSDQGRGKAERIEVFGFAPALLRHLGADVLPQVPECWHFAAGDVIGDGHAGQGNGEVDITAMETFLTGTFRFVVHKDEHLLWPRAETPTSYISMGFSPDLKTATEMAVRNMIDFLVTEKHLSRDEAYMLTSVAVDVDITQLVDGNVGVHAICPQGIFKE